MGMGANMGPPLHEASPPRNSGSRRSRSTSRLTRYYVAERTRSLWTVRKGFRSISPAPSAIRASTFRYVIPKPNLLMDLKLTRARRTPPLGKWKAVTYRRSLTSRPV